MSIIGGLLSLPFGFAIQAYKQACFELPLQDENFKRIHKNDSRYNEILKSLPGNHIKDAMQPFLDKVGIRKDLIFVEYPNMGFCSAKGTNMFRKNDAAVIIAPDFYEASNDACSWMMKHEISHIKHNDTFTMSCVPGICQFAASIFGMCFLSFLSTLGVVYTVGLVSQSVFSKWREAKADDFAIENSSDEELKGGRRLLMAMQETSLEERNTFWKRIAISSNGDNRLDFMHPSNSNRIQKIEKVLRERESQSDKATEKQNMKCMKRYVADKKRELESAVQQNGGTLALLLQMLSF